MSAHLTEWTLRRLHAGELPGAESQQARAHLSACAECHGVLEGFEAEQARFESQVPFERFEKGVERALENPPEERSRPGFHGFMVAVAATVLLALFVRPMLAESPTHNRLKGGATAELRIAGDGAQRAVPSGDTDTLQPGERVRVGYVAGAYGYVLALSVDEAGEVTPLYSESGTSLPVEPPGDKRHWLPESVEFTGSGDERVMVVLSERPLKVDEVVAAARRAWESAGRKVAEMPTLGVDGEESHWLLHKPQP
ncbi:ACP synthase [Archangium sp.]|uniref:ACP synthase n=1 Tax=Archangium sp. TaxID=1872627 RepID=UPI003899B2A9